MASVMSGWAVWRGGWRSAGSRLARLRLSLKSCGDLYVLLAPNARLHLLPEAGAQRTL
jgi:hypothetical protein